MPLIILLRVSGARRAASLLAGAALLAGCGGGPEPARGQVREAGELVEALERALAARDAGRICSDLLSAEARRLAGGEECRGRIARELAGLRRPTLEPVAITLRRDGRVSVRVKARSADAGERQDTLELVPQPPSGRLKIGALTG